VEEESDGSYSGLIEAALEISRKKVQKLKQLRAAQLATLLEPRGEDVNVLAIYLDGPQHGHTCRSKPYCS
jgi:hypothetical protein